MTKVCIYAICKNEADNAAEWYKSVEDADHVIVLDTGSDDGTPDILMDLGCTVETELFHPFRFDEARNHALDLALDLTDADVFMALDFDERLEPGWKEALVESWDPERHTRGSYDLYLGSKADVPMNRNWVHDRTWMWKYPVHEAMIRRYGGSIWYTPAETCDLHGKVSVRHKDMDNLKPNHKQYLDLMRLRFKEERDQESAAYLAREYMYRVMPDESLLMEPEFLMLDLSGNPGAWVCICLAWAHEAKKDLDGAMALLFRAYLMDPGNRTAPTDLVRHLSNKGFNELALAFLDEVYRTASSYSPNYLFVDNQDVWKWRLDDWRGVCLARCGRWAEALVWYRRALAGTAEGSWERDHVNANISYAEKMIGGDAK